MNNKQAIQTKGALAPLGSYSQAIKMGTTVYLSGQIPLYPEQEAFVEGDIKAQAKQVFENLAAVA